MSSVFISHATEDKDAVARPLAKALKDRGYDVWYDEYSLKLGDSLRRRIDEGLAQCSFGIVVLSKAFFSKEWPKKELDALNARETHQSQKIILPVWHSVTANEIAGFSPMLADRLGVSTSDGLGPVIQQIVDVIGSPDQPGIEAQDEDNAIFSFKERNLRQWQEFLGEIFPQGKPASAAWHNIEDIVSILQKLSSPNLNHSFFPEGGGQDLSGCKKSLEADCIELLWGHNYASIVKPSSLSFESFLNAPSLSYFRLDLKFLKPWSDGIDLTEYQSEELAELFPMEYHNRNVFDAGYYDHDESGNEIRIPEGSRVITRHFSGSFVIFAKGSYYNSASGELDAYRARHNKMTAIQFKQYISAMIEAASRAGFDLEKD
ncbi:toll/interleukin-1 receptor domain-containing protein [Phragmitibacter flavus]|uniref:Toll/interleukin-1 receptor domain-containing protein n=1 Tax=Phragmitibacter flavus TaxID=2576071 RepID=A0A5R8K7I2_9BACT|nr:toll/interleukin-1 receptor domain-containing protein [Phragmitibacter flavus]TLD68321.1 toll/interleukin-1 receptor domain-containing protein [Phragmitibacter flavus]